MTRLTIRAQITLFAGLLGVILVVATAGLAMYLAQKREIQVGEDKVVRLAVDMADALDRGMYERYREIRMLGDLELLRDIWVSRPEAVQPVLDALQDSLPDYAWIGFALPDGTVQAATDGLLVGADVSERPWFVGGLKGDFVGDVHEAKLLAGLLTPRPDGEPFRFVDVATRVSDAQGKSAGVLGAHLSWSWASDLRETIISPDLAATSTDVWILAADGKVLLGPGIGTNRLSPERVSEMLVERQGVFVDESTGEAIFTGFSVADGFRDYPGLEWIVLARQPESFALATARGRVTKIATIGIVVALLGLGLFAVAGGRIGRPILLLTHEADRIGRDPEATMFPRVVGSREVELLSSSLRSFLRRIGDAERRTAESEERRASEGRRYNDDVDELRRLADTDSLTGLLNRRAFKRSSTEALERFRRYGRTFAILVADIDHFKKVNDTHGHAAGDAVIKNVADILMRSVRTPDRVARAGGEEFVVLLHEISADDALALAERIRRDVADSHVSQDRVAIKTTISIGVSIVAAADRDLEDLVARADAALYDAKSAGRNRSTLRMPAEAKSEAEAA